MLNRPSVNTAGVNVRGKSRLRVNYSIHSIGVCSRVCAESDMLDKYYSIINNLVLYVGCFHAHAWLNEGMTSCPRKPIRSEGPRHHAAKPTRARERSRTAPRERTPQTAFRAGCAAKSFSLLNDRGVSNRPGPADRGGFTVSKALTITIHRVRSRFRAGAAL